jgi:TetR/AcrR family transcriptional regulator, cholesterol catabolism regulator
METQVSGENMALRRPRGRPRKTEQERDDGNRRRELIRSAARLFRRKGFHATSTRDIAAAVGMQSGSPFYHFESKTALLAAVMEEGMRTAIARQQKVLEQADGAEAPTRLRVLIRNHFDVLLGPGSDFIPVMLYEARSITSRQRAAIASAAKRVRGAMDAGAAGIACVGAHDGRRQAGAPVDLRRAELVGPVVRPPQGRVAG